MSKVWFITGASRGLGLSIACAAFHAGHRVVATGRSPSRLIANLPADSGRLLPLKLDVTQRNQVESAAQSAIDSFHRIDVLVNNAGYGQFGCFEENDDQEIERQFATNLFGLMNVTRAVLPIMRAQGSGHIFNMSSRAGVAGAAGASVYSASKFAVEGLSEGLAQEVSSFGIRVTIVEPGPFRTDFLDRSSLRFGRRCIDDYGELSQRIRAGFEARNGSQPGNPHKLAAALLELARSERPPLRFAAGSEAVGPIESKLATWRAEIDAWRALSLSTDRVQ